MTKFDWEIPLKLNLLELIIEYPQDYQRGQTKNIHNAHRQAGRPIDRQQNIQVGRQRQADKQTGR